MTDTNPAFALTLEGLRKGPKYLKLLHALEAGIRAGHLPPGMKLPPVRTLAYKLGITPGTVARAYRMAVDDGMLEATTGRGTFVRGRTRPLVEVPENKVAAATEQGMTNLRSGHTPDVGQTGLIHEALRAVLDEGGLNLSHYVRDAALAACQREASAWMRGLGVDARAEDLVLTNGGHNAVMVALAATMSRPNPVVAVPQLTYPGFRQSAHVLRGRMVPVAMDGEGMDPDDFGRVCLTQRPGVLLLSSNVDNPTTVMLSPERRQAIAALAERFDVQIVEDDVYGSLLDERPEGFDRLCPTRTWTATSLSKCFAAGVRIGFLACPPGAGDIGVRLMQGFSLAMPQPMTSLVERLFVSGAVGEVRARVAAENSARVAIARQVLGRWDVASRERIAFVWLRIPPGWTGSAFHAAMEAEGVVVSPGDVFTVPGGDAPNAVRLTLSSPDDHGTLAEALGRVDAVLSRAPVSILA